MQQVNVWLSLAITVVQAVLDALTAMENDLNPVPTPTPTPTPTPGTSPTSNSNMVYAGSQHEQHQSGFWNRK